MQALKEFAHPATALKQPIDLNHAIANTLMVARNEWRLIAEVETDLAADLPPVPCLPGEIGQVFLNLIINAAQAIADAVGTSGALGRLRVTTRLEDGWAVVRISDSGPGIPPAIRERIFDPFFTTKPVGKGTGQGLYLAREAVVGKHGGSIAFDCPPGQGTTFVVRLPL